MSVFYYSIFLLLFLSFVRFSNFFSLSWSRYSVIRNTGFFSLLINFSLSFYSFLSPHHYLFINDNKKLYSDLIIISKETNYLFFGYFLTILKIYIYFFVIFFCFHLDISYSLSSRCYLLYFSLYRLRHNLFFIVSFVVIFSLLSPSSLFFIISSLLSPSLSSLCDLLLLFSLSYLLCYLLRYPLFAVSLFTSLYYLFSTLFVIFSLLSSPFLFFIIFVIISLVSPLS